MSAAAQARRASESDREEVVELISRAFFADPTWSWAFPDPATRLDDYSQWWDLFVSSALPHGWVWLTEDGASAAVWIPPGMPELSEEHEARLEPLAHELIAEDRVDDVMRLLELFDESHPEEPPHYYLSLLATDPDRRGRGSGLGLLAANLAEIDAEGAPAYLEASNPANVRLYERFGFSSRGRFGFAGSPQVASMWREPAP